MGILKNISSTACNDEDCRVQIVLNKMRPDQTVGAESTSLLARALGVLLGPAAGPIQAKRGVSELASVGSPPVFSLSPSGKLMEDLRDEGYTHVHRFTAIPSQSMPRWLLPIGDRRGTLAGTQVYLPHTWATRTMKSLLIGMIKMGWKGRLGSRVLVASQGPSALEVLVRAVTEEPQPVFALMLGRLPAVRKLTVQVMRSQGDVLGYIKLPLTDAATQRVRNEATILERLWNFPALRPHIPRLLYAGNWNDTYVLFQSSLEGKVGPMSFDGLHEKFLNTLRNVHSVEKFGQGLIDEVAAKWLKAAPILGDKWIDLGREVLRRSTRNLHGKMLLYSVMHGDFAPWNTRVRRGELLLFDWECGDWEAPSSWDIFRFHVQTAYAFKKNPERYLLDLGRLDEASFTLYLLNWACELLQEGNHGGIGLCQRLLTSQLRKKDVPLESPASTA
jgi:hypothetical protein